MPRGGRRAGAGRKAGEAWAPKQPSDIRSAARQRVRALIADGRDPLTLLLAIAEDERQNAQLRVEAAARAAPFCFPRLSTVALSDAVRRLSKAEAQSLVDQLQAGLRDAL